MGDLTLAGVVMFSGSGVVIFITGFWVIIFGEAAHAAVVRPATINPVTAMVVTDFIFIVETPFYNYGSGFRVQGYVFQPLNRF
jgi:hypothetical protein